MCVKRARCPDCDGGFLAGDGRCSHCHGSGTNLKLASDVPQCAFCKGTGVCQTCDGSGLYSALDDSDSGEIQTLFK
jgi:hypothetical protein